MITQCPAVALCTVYSVALCTVYGVALCTVYSVWHYAHQKLYTLHSAIMQCTGHCTIHSMLRLSKIIFDYQELSVS